MLALPLLSLLAAQAIDAKALDASVKEVLPTTFDLYRWFHENPELSKQEVQTASRLAKELEALGAEVTTGVGGHGILAVLRGAGAGPTVLFRADMDGLPVTEATGLPYSSKNAGVMHACGHDIHMASALGAMRVLAKHRDLWKGTVLLVGQPAEEVGSGARAMLADKKMAEVLKKIGKPVVSFALHDSSDAVAGSVEIGPGWQTANVDSLDITVYGKGGHGARPHQTVDPIVIGSEIVMSLQTIVARRMKPGTPAVVTVGKFEAGTKHNIIPPTALLLLTVRSYGDADRKFLLDEIKRTASGIARAHGAPKDPDIKIGTDFTPANFNDPTWTARLDTLFKSTLGKEKVTLRDPTTGGEDFGEFATAFKVPGVMWWLGAQSAAKKKADWSSVHSDRYAPDPKPTLETGVRSTVGAVLEALKQ